MASTKEKKQSNKTKINKNGIFLNYAHYITSPLLKNQFVKRNMKHSYILIYCGTDSMKLGLQHD